jgi:hypothetical protein
MALMQLVTPTLWPEATQPTAEQLAEWLKICTDAERVWFVEKYQQFADEASRCWQEDHASQIDYWRRAHERGHERCEQHAKALDAVRRLNTKDA